MHNIRTLYRYAREKVSDSLSSRLIEILPDGTKKTLGEVKRQILPSDEVGLYRLMFEQKVMTNIEMPIKPSSMIWMSRP